MCLVSFAYQYPQGFDLILVANRDEFFNRPTEPAHYWTDNPSVWGGLDLQSKGTWLAVTQHNRFAFLTNVRDFHNPSKVQDPISRGLLVKDFVVGNLSPKEYAKEVESKFSRYEGFNLVVGDSHSAYYLNNHSYIQQPLTPGIYTLSNSVLDKPWPKVVKAKKDFALSLYKYFLEKKELEDNNNESNWMNFSDKMFEYFSNRELAEDSLLPNTGIGIDLERKLSSVLVEFEGYGTRSTSVIVLGKNQQLLREKIIQPSILS